MELVTLKEKRKKYIRPGWIIFITLVIIMPVLAFLLAKILPKEMYWNTFLRYIMAFMFMQSIPSLCIAGGFLLFCYGRSGTQRLTLFDDELVYFYYSGSGPNREEYTLYIKDVERYTMTNRTLTVYGDIKKVTVDAYGKGEKMVRKIAMARVFDKEDKVIEFLDSHKK